MEAVIDDNPRYQGEQVIGRRNLTVRKIEDVSDKDIQDAVFIIMSDYYNEAYERLLRLLVGKKYFETIYYFENRETEIEMVYRRSYKTFALKNIIIFRSGPHAASYVKGMDFADNARALFEYMLENGYNEKYEMVWLVKDPSEFERFQEIPNVKFLSFEWSVSEEKEERDQYYRALCLAKFLFFTDAYGFARNCRKDQIRIQLWHGCGFKTSELCEM